jgi:hypothetical protein
MVHVEQLDIFVILQEIEDQAEAARLSEPAPVTNFPVLEPNKPKTPFLKRLGTGLSWFWIVTHNLFGIACWVNVYTITRAFGGREAGGWYYLKYECEKSRQVGFWEAQTLRMQWLLNYSKSHKWGDLRLRTGGQEVVVSIESRKAAQRTQRAPLYEDYADRAIPYLSIQ